MCVFHKNDTHLNDLGSFFVAQRVLKFLDAQYELKDLFFEEPVFKRGDLVAMLGSKVTEPVTNLSPFLSPLVFENLAFLPGNTNHVRIIHNPYAFSERRLLIFGDSFIFLTAKFLAPAFRDVTYIRSATFQKDMIQLYAPDVVISSNVERYLSKVESDNQSTPMLFSTYGKSDYKPSDIFSGAYKAQLSKRYHPHIYQDWCREINLQIHIVPGLGPYQMIQMVLIDRSDLTFESKGKDPYFTFSSTEILPGHHYCLQIDLISELTSVAKVYYQDITLAPSFNELRSVSLPVKVGLNSLSFNLDGPNLGRRLRFDPLTCPGIFKISKVVLTASPCK
jgi:hypothetical protein